MNLETERLIIRKYVDTDKNDFDKLIIDKMNSPYAIYDAQFPTDANSLIQIFNYFIGSNEVFAVEVKERSKVIGFITLNYVDDKTRNLGYCLHSDYHHQGLGKEMVKAIMNYVKNDLNIEKLVAGTAEENIQSVKLLQGVGFKLIKKELVSFTNDEKGNPIAFIGCSFECIL